MAATRCLSMVLMDIPSLRLLTTRSGLHASKSHVDHVDSALALARVEARALVRTLGLWNLGQGSIRSSSHVRAQATLMVASVWASDFKNTACTRQVALRSRNSSSVT